MEETVKKAGVLGGALNNWIKIISVILFIVGSGFLTYSEIKFNTAENTRQDVMDKEILETMKREFEIQHERSDKRYTRATEMYKDLHEHDNEQESQLLDLTKEIWYLKGKLDEQDKH